MPTIDEYAISLPDGASILVQAAEDFWRAIDDIALSLLRLPDRRLKKRLRDVGGESDEAITKRVARLVAEMIIPDEVELCCSLIVAVPAFFEGYVAYRGDGTMRAKDVFEARVEREIQDYLESQWDGYLVRTKQTPEDRESKGRGKLDDILRPPPPPDPYEGWTPERWLQAYSDASLQDKTRIRHAAAQRGIESGKWPGVAEELRERYRTSSEWQGFQLRVEAKSLGLSTDLWNRRKADEPLPVDMEKTVRDQLLQDLRALPRPETLEAYCGVLVAFALRAKQSGASELWQAFRAMAVYWIEAYDQGAASILRSLRQNGAFYWQHPDNVQSLQFLARYEVGACMQEILQKHFI